MRKILIALGIVFLMIVSCTKEIEQTKTGVITSTDERRCMCCSGWFIQINNNTYRFKTVPEACTLNLDNAVFPIEVEIEWNKNVEQCLGDEIEVTMLKKR